MNIYKIFQKKGNIPYILRKKGTPLKLTWKMKIKW